MRCHFPGIAAKTGSMHPVISRRSGPHPWIMRIGVPSPWIS